MRIRERFNPRAPCGARPKLPDQTQNQKDFNPRAPCGARPPVAESVGVGKEFQPTRPLRGATLYAGERK